MLRNGIFLIACYIATLIGSTSGSCAGLTITITEGAAGGTNWAFSDGTGTIGPSGYDSLIVGGTNQNFHFLSYPAAMNSGVSVLAGTNAYGIANLSFFDGKGANGNAGQLYDVLSIGFTTPNALQNQPLSGFNGLSLYASGILFDQLNPGSYALNSFFAVNTYTFDGNVTLNIETPVPAVGVGLPLAFAGLMLWCRRRQRANARA